jgi:hypothetical protein
MQLSNPNRGSTHREHHRKTPTDAEKDSQKSQNGKRGNEGDRRHRESQHRLTVPRRRSTSSGDHDITKEESGVMRHETTGRTCIPPTGRLSTSPPARSGSCLSCLLIAAATTRALEVPISSTPQGTRCDSPLNFATPLLKVCDREIDSSPL